MAASITVIQPPTPLKVDLDISINRVENYARKFLPKDIQLAADVPLVLTSNARYIASELIEIAAVSAEESKRLTIRPRDIYRAITNDKELKKTLGHLVILGSGGSVDKNHPNVRTKKEKHRLEKEAKLLRKAAKKVSAAKAPAPAPTAAAASVVVTKKKKAAAAAPAPAPTPAAKKKIIAPVKTPTKGSKAKPAAPAPAPVASKAIVKKKK